MSKISSIKVLFDKINILDYTYVTGFISKATNSDDIVRSASTLETSNRLAGSNWMLQNAATLIRTVGYIAINQSVPWQLESRKSTWHRMVHNDYVPESIDSAVQSPPVVALCLTHPNGSVELLLAQLPSTFSAQDLSLFHSSGLQILASSPQIADLRRANLLSSAERKCLVWCARGKTSYEMGLILGLSEHTINHYLGRVQKKLDVSSRAQAVAAAIKTGVIALESLD